MADRYTELQKLIGTQYAGDLSAVKADLSKLEAEGLVIRRATRQNKLKDAKVLVSLKNVSKKYKTGGEIVEALADINLEIREGEFMAVCGPSGSGKSTLLNLIGGLDKPTEGEILVNNYNLQKLKDRELSSYRNETIGFIFQFFYLQPYLNVLQNAEIPLVFRGVRRSERVAPTQKAIEQINLTKRTKHLPKELSGGETQRVGIARAVVGSPKIILADEPSANLDRANANEVVNLLRQINQDSKTCVIIVTHDELIADQTDRIVKMQDGKIVSDSNLL